MSGTHSWWRRGSLQRLAIDLRLNDGNPYGTSHVDSQGTRAVDEPTRAAARYQAQQVVKVARQLKSAA